MMTHSLAGETWRRVGRETARMIHSFNENTQDTSNVCAVFLLISFFIFTSERTQSFLAKCPPVWCKISPHTHIAQNCLRFEACVWSAAQHDTLRSCEQASLSAVFSAWHLTDSSQRRFSERFFHMITVTICSFSDHMLMKCRHEKHCKCRDFNEEETTLCNEA